MNFLEAVGTCFRKYADFKGRARRSEFWFWKLFTYSVGIFLLKFLEMDSEDKVFLLVHLIFLVPDWAVAVRRLHDMGKSGWNVLWFFIPVIGWIILLLYLVKDSETGANKWGFNPKEMEDSF